MTVVAHPLSQFTEIQLVTSSVGNRTSVSYNQQDVEDAVRAAADAAAAAVADAIDEALLYGVCGVR